MSALELVPFVVLGLAGSLHCAGMCGPLALSFALGRGAPRASDVAAYVLGKAAMYSVLALFAARTIAEVGARQPGWLAGLRASLAVVAALVMLSVALSALGWLRTPRWRWFGSLEKALRGALRGTDELPGAMRGLAFGAANGLLPCGLSWSAIALGAAAAEPSLALAGPFVFGLATGPVLGALALGAGRIPATWRARGARLAALALLGYGTWTLARGLQPLAPESSAKVLPECCTDELVSSPETR